MSENPLVSVFLPAYNQEKFIAEAIESALNQDYGNIEIVVGDDFSTDGTWEIIKNYQKKFPNKLKTFRNSENLGITKNCNEILKRCTGKYIAYSAGDDLYLPGKISKQVHLMESIKECVMSHHYVETFHSSSGETLFVNNIYFKDRDVIIETSSSVAKSIISLGNSYIHGLSIMVLRNAIPSNGYDCRIPVASDWLMWVDILARSAPNSKVIFIPEILAKYRRHQDNVTSEGYKHTDDMHITLAIIEDRYPNLIKATEQGRAHIRSSVGIKLIKESYDRRNGRKIILRSILGGHITRQNIYWLIYSLWPRISFLRKILGR